MNFMMFIVPTNTPKTFQKILSRNASSEDTCTKKYAVLNFLHLQRNEEKSFLIDKVMIIH